MGFENITNAITTAVEALMTAKSYTARYDNDPRANPKTGFWVKVNVTFGDSDQIELGDSPLYRNPGLLTMQIVGPISKGTGTFKAMADILATAFRSITLGGYIKFRTPRIEQVGRIGDNWNVNVLCPFHADEN